MPFQASLLHTNSSPTVLQALSRKLYVINAFQSASSKPLPTPPPGMRTSLQGADPEDVEAAMAAAAASASALAGATSGGLDDGVDQWAGAGHSSFKGNLMDLLRLMAK